VPSSKSSGAFSVGLADWRKFFEECGDFYPSIDTYSAARPVKIESENVVTFQDPDSSNIHFFDQEPHHFGTRHFWWAHVLCTSLMMTVCGSSTSIISLPRNWAPKPGIMCSIFPSKLVSWRRECNLDVFERKNSVSE